VDTALLRDVIERHAVSNPVALRWMVRHLLSNPAGTFSVNTFHADLHSRNIAVAKDTSLASMMISDGIDGQTDGSVTAGMTWC
jgi:predicted AAA+ superfamily ATPase